MPVKTNGFMDWTRLFRGLEARVALFLLTVLLASSCALGHADSRRMVITQDRDQNINVSVDPSLMPDANIRREKGRMVIELPDKAFPKGFPPGTLRVDSDSKGFVRVGRTDTSTTVTIDSDQVFLSIEKLSAPPQKVSPKPTPSPEASPSVANPSQGKIESEAKASEKPIAQKAHPAKPIPASEPEVKPESSRTATPGKTETLPEPKRPVEKPAAEIESREKKPTKTEHSKEDALKEPVDPEKPPEIQPQAEEPPSLAEEEAVTPESEPEAEPTITHEGETGIPLDALLKQRPEPVTSDGTLIRVIAGLLAVLLMIAGFFKYLLPELMRRYPDFFKNRQEVYEQKKADLKTQANKGRNERPLGLGALKKRQALQDTDASPDIPETALGDEALDPLPESMNETYPLFRHAGISPALGEQDADSPTPSANTDSDDRDEWIAPRYEQPEFRMPTIPRVTLPKISMPALSFPKFSAPRLPKPLLPKFPELRPPDFSPVQLKMTTIWRRIKKKMEPDPDRYMKQIKEMNSAFDVLYTRNLSRNKALHLVDLWGRHMIIATTPKSVTLLGVMRGEGRDLYFEDLTVDNVRLLGDVTRGQSAASYILEFYNQARASIVREANQATKASEEADFDELYRKYLKEQEVRREKRIETSQQVADDVDASPPISVDVSGWMQPVFPKKPVEATATSASPEIKKPTTAEFDIKKQDIEKQPVVTHLENQENRHQEILREVVRVVRPHSEGNPISEPSSTSISTPETALPRMRRKPARSTEKSPPSMEEVVYLHDYDDEYHE